MSMRLHSRRFWGVVLAAILSLADTCWAEEIVPRSAVFVLVDVSGTWLSKNNLEQNKQVVRETNKAVVDLLGKVESPSVVFLIAIEADSVLSKPICVATYSRKLLNLGKRKNAFTSRDKLADHLELCGLAVLARPIAKWTDIHGALDMTSRLANSGTFSGRYLFVLSAFIEERPPGPLPLISLNGFRVASIYRILPQDSQDPRGLDSRLEKWRSLLKKAGVDRTIDAVDKGRFAGSVVQKLLRDD